MSRPLQTSLIHRLLVWAAAGLVILGLVQALLLSAQGAQLGSRSLQLSTSVVSATASYQLSFNISTPGTLGSIAIQFCSNTPFDTDPCSPPSGFSASSAVLSDQSGETGFSIDSASTANTIILSRTPSASVVGPVSYSFTGMVNPDALGSYFVRLQTFASGDASGSASDYGGIAFAINNDLAISAEVPPFVVFCTGISIPTLDCSSATGDYINFGELSSSHTSQGLSQMAAATNAKDGYSVTVTGTTLTSGNNVINALASSDVSRPGSAQFGFNLRANASPSGGNDPAGPGVGVPAPNYAQSNFYRFTTGEIVASSTQPDDMRQYTASYIVNVPRTQAPGVYVSTITYVCLGNF